MKKIHKAHMIISGLGCLLLSQHLFSASVTIQPLGGERSVSDNVPCCESSGLEQGSDCKDSCKSTPVSEQLFNERGLNLKSIGQAETDVFSEAQNKGDDDELWTNSIKASKSSKTCKKDIVLGPPRCATGLFNVAIAKSRAKKAWKDKVEDLFGSAWNSWSRAEDKDPNWWGPSWSTCATYEARPCAKNSDLTPPISDDPDVALPAVIQRHAVDVNNDGLSDIIFVGQDWNGPGLNIRVKMSNGNGTYTHHQSVLGDGSGVHTYPSLVGDFDGDGSTDIAFVGQNWSGAGLNIRTKLSNGNGTFSAYSQVLGDGAGVHQFPAKVGDFNGDDKDDLLFYFQTPGTGLQVRVKLSNGNGTFTATTQTLGDGSGVTSYPAIIADMNNDNKDDLVFAFQHWNGSGLNIRTKMSNGNGTFTHYQSVLGDGSGVHTYPPLVGDFNGDGNTDIAFVGQNWSGAGLNIRTKLSNGNGTFSAYSQVLGDGQGVHANSALVADYNGDSYSDIAFVGQNWNGSGLNIRVKQSNGNGTFSSSYQVMGDGSGVHTHSALLGDIDGNNFADIIFVGQNWSGAGLNIRTKLSDGVGGFVAVSDVQGDGPGIHTYPPHSGALE